MIDWTPDQPLLQIENLSISFFTRLREIPAVMDFSCTVMPGEAMGLVGESAAGGSCSRAATSSPSVRPSCAASAAPRSR
jgi:ABC-type glutathione transport system ATPase component